MCSGVSIIFGPIQLSESTGIYHMIMKIIDQLSYAKYLVIL